MSYVDDGVRWQRASASILNICKSTDDAFYTNINVILDELNSLDFSLNVVASNEEALQVLSKCCTIVPGNGTNDLLATKLCQLIINLFSRQKVAVNQVICDVVLEFLIGSIQCCQKWAFVNHLRAFNAVCLENGFLCSKFAGKLLASVPQGLLTAFIEEPGWDVDVRCKAMNCVGNICSKGPGGTFIDEEYAQRALEIILDVIRFLPREITDDMSHFRLVLAALKALQTVQVALPILKKEHEQLLLAALKNCMFCGLPGYNIAFVKRSSSPQATSLGIYPDDLSSINLNTMAPKSRSYQNAAALNNKKKKKRTGHHKNKGYAPNQTSYAPPSLGPKFKRDYSSVDALMPSFTKTTISPAPAEKVPPSKQSPIHTKNVAKEKTDDNVSLTKSSEENKATEAVSQDNATSSDSGHSSGTETISAASSDSDFSDSEAGQAARIRSLTTKIRLNALSCLELVVKRMEKKVLFGYWSSFIPDAGPGSTWSLFTTILRDPSPRARAGGVAVLSELLDRSRQFLAAADDRSEGSAVVSARPFTSFSGRLGGTIHEIHRHLLQALLAETSVPTKLHLMKCLSMLILNAPYNRLKEGLITRIVRRVKPMLQSQDFNIRVAALTCLGMVVSVHAPLQEVVELMKTSQAASETHSTEHSKDAVEHPAVVTGNPRDRCDTEDKYPWLVKSCIDLAACQQGNEAQPLVVRTEALQVLIAFVRNYFHLVSPCLDGLITVACACIDDDQAIGVFAIKLLQELGRVMYTFLPDQSDNKTPIVTVTKQQLLKFWLDLLNGPLVSILQGSNPKLTSSAVDCLTNIGAQIFELLPENKAIVCITMFLGLCNDEDKNVKASAVRAVGVLVLYPCLREDVLYVADTANAVLSCMEDQTMAVKMRAAWSLGNLSDTLVANKGCKDSMFVQDFSDMLLLKLLDLAITASDGHEKVKSNAVRALGNFLNYVQPATLEKRGFARCVEKAVQALVTNVGSGLMKVRWNACYAIGNMFRNTTLPIGIAEWTADIFTALTNVIKECKNFKVRINAVLSLSVLPERRCYGDVSQFLGIVQALVSALELSNTLTEFSEFKYQDNLRAQLCNTLCHLVSLIGEEDLAPLVPILENNRGILHFLSDHVTSVLSQDSNEAEQDERENNPDNNETESKGASHAERKHHVQAARIRVFDELNRELPSVQILCDVLTVKEKSHPVRTGPAMTND